MVYIHILLKLNLVIISKGNIKEFPVFMLKFP